MDKNDLSCRIIEYAEVLWDKLKIGVEKLEDDHQDQAIEREVIISQVESSHSVYHVDGILADPLLPHGSTSRNRCWKVVSYIFVRCESTCKLHRRVPDFGTHMTQIIVLENSGGCRYISYIESALSPPRLPYCT